MGAPAPPYVVPDGVFCVSTLVDATPFGTVVFDACGLESMRRPMPSACLSRQL